MESSPFHAVSSCRDSCLNTPPWPTCFPFPSYRVVFPSLHRSFFSPSNSPLFFFHSLLPLATSASPLTKSCRGEQQRALSLQGLTAAEALVASCVVKCLFGMQSCDQPPSPPAPPQAPRQWASVCKAKLQSSLGNDLPVPYSRWLEAESTPLPLSSVPMHIRTRRLFLPYSCSQPSKARGVTLLTGGSRGVILSLLSTAMVGSEHKGADPNASHVHGRKGDGFTLTGTTWLCRRAASLHACLFLSGRQGRRGELGCIGQDTSKPPVS